MITLKIDGLSHSGKGIGRMNGKAVFIANTLPGDEVNAQITEQYANYSEAKLKTILKPSPDRVVPFCPVYTECGGCQLQHTSIAAQRRYKTTNFMTALKKSVNMRKCKTATALVSDDTQYRKRARFAYGRNKSDKLVNFGFRKQGSASIVDIKHCPLLTPAINKAIKAKRAQVLPDASRAIKELTVVETSQGVVWSDEQTEAEYKLKLAEQTYHFNFPSNGFIQVNKVVNQQMIQQAIKWLELESQHQVLDLFCGVGNFTLPLASMVAQVIGIEGDINSIEFARQNSSQNNLSNTLFYKANLFEDVTGHNWFYQQKYDRILLDPGRQGAFSISKLLGQLKASIIVYVSCNAATLIRDIKELEKQGYQIRKAGFMDMFPHTSHAEVMVQLVKTKKPSKQKKQRVFKL